MRTGFKQVAGFVATSEWRLNERTGQNVLTLPLWRVLSLLVIIRGVSRIPPLL